MPSIPQRKEGRKEGMCLNSAGGKECHAAVLHLATTAKIRKLAEDY